MTHKLVSLFKTYTHTIRGWILEWALIQEDLAGGGGGGGILPALLSPLDEDEAAATFDLVKPAVAEKYFLCTSTWFSEAIGFTISRPCQNKGSVSSSSHWDYN